MNLNAGRRARTQRVEDCDGRVSVCARVEYQSRKAVFGGRSDPIDDRAFMIRLPRIELHIELPCTALEPTVNLLQREPAIDLRLSHSEPLKIWA